MPVIFKHARQKPAFTPSTSSFGSQQRLGAQKAYLGVVDGVPAGEGRRGIRHRGSIFLHRGSVRARHSISRLRHKSSSIQKYIQDPKLLIKLAKDIYHKRHLKHLVPLIFVLLYMLLGAVIFFSIEASIERDRLSRRNLEYAEERLLFVKRVEEIIVDTASPPNSTRRREFVQEAVDHLRSQLGHGPPPPEPEWTFLTSMYFAGTIFTTIGYGDIACDTFLGQVATVAYAIFGIPLMLITLNELGKFLYKTINEFMAMLNKRWKALAKRRKWRQKSENEFWDNESARDEEELEKGMRGNHLPGQRSPTEEMKAVSFNLNAKDAEADYSQDNLDGIAEHKRSLQQEKTQNGTSVWSTKNAGDFGIMMEEASASENEDEEEGEEEEEEEEDEQYRRPHSRAGSEADKQQQGEAPRMHVMVAIVTTFAWIFLCAALFKIWEKDWSYWDSLYFMFISLLTIGLGDVNVQRRDLMVLCFMFVIIGLSLVSMCINVIQSSLEDFYRKMLIKVLADYQASLNKDGSHKNASIGVMKALGGSKTAKLLVPLMSDSTKRAVMQQVQEEARDAGIEIPPIFEHFETIDELIGNKDIAKDEDARSAVLDEILRPLSSADTSSFRDRSCSFKLRENHTQTELIQKDDKNDQTMGVEWDEMQTQTDLSQSLPKKRVTDAEQQTEGAVLMDEGVQTRRTSTREAEAMTSGRLCSMGQSVDTQTERALCLDEEVQTFAMVGTFDGVTQTDERQTKNQRIQTPIPVLENAEAQTDEVRFREGQVERLYAPLKLYLDLLAGSAPTK